MWMVITNLSASVVWATLVSAARLRLMNASLTHADMVGLATTGSTISSALVYLDIQEPTVKSTLMTVSAILVSMGLAATWKMTTSVSARLLTQARTVSSSWTHVARTLAITTLSVYPRTATSPSTSATVPLDLLVNIAIRTSTSVLLSQTLVEIMGHVEIHTALSCVHVWMAMKVLAVKLILMIVIQILV